MTRTLGFLACRTLDRRSLGVPALLAVAGLCCAPSFAACNQAGTEPTVTFSGGTSAGFEYVVTENCTTERWDVTIRSVMPATFTPTATIFGDSTTKLGIVTVQRVATLNLGQLVFGGPLSVSVGTPTVPLHSVVEVRRSFVDEYRGCVPLDPTGTNPCPEDGIPPEWFIDISHLRVVNDWGAAASNAATDIRKIENVFVGGDVLGAVVQDIGDTNSIASSITIAGNLRASWLARRIESLIVVNRIGIDGTKTEDVVIDATQGIGTITAGSIFATIWSGERDTVNGPGMRMPIDQIEVRGETVSPFDDEVHGRISMSKLGSEGFANPEISITGSLVGTISLTEPLQHPIVIGEAMGLGARIELPNNGLRSQIIVNANGNTSNPSNYWKSDAKVVIKASGPPPAVDIVITDPVYSQIPSTLAGTGNDGSIGLAPFGIHHTACVPPQDGFVFVTALSMFTLDCLPINPIRLRMYGPVILDEEDPHFEVLTKDGNGDFTVHAFDAYAEVVSGTDSRTLKIIPDTAGGAWPFGEFAIVRIDGKVLSRDVAGTPTVAAVLHRFEAADGCGLMLLQGFDLNSDDTLCSADIGAWLSSPVDLNNDDVADQADLVHLINAIQLYPSVNP